MIDLIILFETIAVVTIAVVAIMSMALVHTQGQRMVKLADALILVTTGQENKLAPKKENRKKKPKSNSTSNPCKIGQFVGFLDKKYGKNRPFPDKCFTCPDFYRCAKL